MNASQILEEFGLLDQSIKKSAGFKNLQDNNKNNTSFESQSFGPNTSFNNVKIINPIKKEELNLNIL